MNVRHIRRLRVCQNLSDSKNKNNPMTSSNNIILMILISDILGESVYSFDVVKVFEIIG